MSYKMNNLYNELYFLITEVQKDVVDAQIEDNMRERARIENLKNRLVDHMNRSYKGILDRKTIGRWDQFR